MHCIVLQSLCAVQTHFLPPPLCCLTLSFLESDTSLILARGFYYQAKLSTQNNKLQVNYTSSKRDQ